MKKICIQILAMSLISVFAKAQMEQYGSYIGGNVFLYKSNLYNAHDAASDSVQKYKPTMGFSGGFDFGYRYLNGISINSGISFGTCNQNYGSKDTIIGDIVDFSATTKMSFIKIPLTVSMQTRNDKPRKAYYSLGVFYSYNTGFSDKATFDFTHNTFSQDYTTTITKETMETVFKNDSLKHSSNLSDRPYKRHGWGAIMAIGASKKLSKNSEGFFQFKVEYQISSSENNDEIIFTPTSGSADQRHVARVWGNYSKYLNNPKNNFNRPNTHPFNLGITFGLRYYLFDFE